jgi:hypothetical protein
MSLPLYLELTLAHGEKASGITAQISRRPLNGFENTIVAARFSAADGRRCSARRHRVSENNQSRRITLVTPTYRRLLSTPGLDGAVPPLDRW